MGGAGWCLVGNWTLSPTEPSICSAINLPPSPSLCSFTHPAIYPSLPVAKGPCLFVALIIWTNFLCNLFPSQPPTWSSSIRLLKVEPLIPASPFAPITFFFFLPLLSLRSFVFYVLKFEFTTGVTQPFLLSYAVQFEPEIFELHDRPNFSFVRCHTKGKQGLVNCSRMASVFRMNFLNVRNFGRLR